MRLQSVQRDLLRLVRQHRAITRGELGRRLKLTPSAVTRNLQSLAALHLVREGTVRSEAQRGRPTLGIELDPAGGVAVGVGIGAGGLQAVALDNAGGRVGEAVRAVAKGRSIEPEDIVGIAKEAAGAAGPLLGVGLAAPGYRTGGEAIWYSDDLPHWRGRDICAEVARALSAPAYFENIANACAIGELNSGRWAGVGTLVFIHLGGGIGAGVVVGGEVHRGAHGNAGEIGLYFPRTTGAPRPSAQDLFDLLAAEGRSEAAAGYSPDRPDPVVSAWIERAADQLVGVLQDAVVWLDPDCLVLGGTLPIAVLQALADSVNQRTIVKSRGGLPSAAVSASRLGAAAGAIGAAQVALHSL